MDLLRPPWQKSKHAIVDVLFGQMASVFQKDLENACQLLSLGKDVRQQSRIEIRHVEASHLIAGKARKAKRNRKFRFSAIGHDSLACIIRKI